MARGINRLTALSVTRAKPGLHGDGGGLWLRLQTGGRAWLFRYSSPVTGRERRMGLGSAQDVTLAGARAAAAEAQGQLQGGLDPLDQRQLAVAARERDLVTFRMAVASCIDAKQAGWRNAKHGTQWTATLEAYAYSTIGDRPVAAVSKADVLAILQPIWQAKPETATRVRGRIETVLDNAKQRDWRTGENLATWKGNLQHVLAHRSKVARVEHHPALPWQQLPAVLERLAASSSTSALAVRFMALTAARSGEARGAHWAEVDLQGRVWTVPADRMKARRDHRVPLSPATLAVLSIAKERSNDAELLFPGGRPGKPLSDVAVSKALHGADGTSEVTVHGLRSTFRDWVADATNHQSDVAEAALAHALGNAVRVAYQRGDLFEKRRQLMEHRSTFCCGKNRHTAHKTPAETLSRE